MSKREKSAMKKISVAVLITLLLLFMFACSKKEGPGRPDISKKNFNDGQAGVVAAIDKLIDQFYDGHYSEEELMEKLTEVIPRPQGFPERPLELIIPAPEGSSADNYARNLGRDAAIIMNEAIFYNNLPKDRGGGALAYLLERPPDGYTLFAASGEDVVNEALDRNQLSFSKNVDFIILSQVLAEAYWVAYDSPFKDMDEVLLFAATRPGKLRVLGEDFPADGRFKVLSLAKELGTEIEYFTRTSATARVAALLDREADLLLEGAGLAHTFYEDNKIRPLAFSGDTRFSEIAPGVPSMADLRFSVPSKRWRGLVTVKGVEAEVAHYLYRCFYAAAKLPYYGVYKNKFNHYFYDAHLGPDEFKAYVLKEVSLLSHLAPNL